MKVSNYQFSTIIFLGLLIFISLALSSFSSIPVATNKANHPPLEKKKITKEQKRQNRLQKRHQHLTERFEQAKTSKKRLHLQKKIRKVERQAGNPAAGYGLTSLLVAIVGGILAILGFLAVFTSSAGLVYGFLVAGLILGLLALASAIVAMVLHKKNPEKSRLGLAIVGLVFSIITVLTAIGILASLSI